MTAARDYEHDKWIAWYVEDTAGWLGLSLGARGAMAEIARKLNAKGEISLRRGLSSLAFILRLEWEGELEPAIAELIAAGKVTWDQSRFILADPEYVARKRRNSADRMRDKRARDAATPKGDASDAGDVTPVTSVTVTPVLVSSSLVSSGSGSLADRETPPVSDRGELPPWWDGACEAAAMVLGGEVPARPVLWAKYLASRKRKTWSMNHTDAVGWLCDVVQSDRNRARAGPAPRQAIGSAAAAPWMNPTSSFDFKDTK